MVKTFIPSRTSISVGSWPQGLAIGIVGGGIGYIIPNLPDSFAIPETFASANTTYNSSVASTDIDIDTIKSQDLSIHFMELGNKYTGDSTLIKVGDTEVLIDAGSRESSVPVLSSYINQYCTDGILEYIIVTHAHQDHYAGFATSSNKDSIFDIYKVNTVIEFAQTNQKNTSKLYSNYRREIS